MTELDLSGRRIEQKGGAKMEMGDIPAVLTVPEAAKLLGLNRNLAYQAVAEGTIPSLRFGRRIVIPRAALERLLSGTGRVA
jgi:excisionase family DNA binding protein